MTFTLQCRSTLQEMFIKKLNLTFLLLTVKSSSTGNTVAVYSDVLFAISHCLNYENPELNSQWKVVKFTY
jgi:hypothetical protein